MSKIELAELIYPSEVESSTDGFVVRSQTDAGKTYSVKLQGNERVPLPVCQCHSWRCTHQPCKHMFAVMKHMENVSWSDLSVPYRESPFFTLDDSVAQFVCDNASGRNNETRDEEISTEMDEVLFTCQKDLPKVQTSCNSLAALCRERLSLINSSTYLCDDMDVLHKVAESLLEVQQYIENSLERDNGLVVNSSKTEKEPTKRKNVKKRKTAAANGDSVKDRKARTAGSGSAKKRKLATTANGGAVGKKKTLTTTTTATKKDETCDIVEKVKLWKKTITDEKWGAMLKRAIITSILTLDEVSEVAHSVLSDKEEDEQCEILVKLQELIPTSMSESARYRMVNMILHTLVQEGHLKTNYDVLAKRDEMARSMKDLAYAAADLSDAASPVQSSQEKSSSPEEFSKRAQHESADNRNENLEQSTKSASNVNKSSTVENYDDQGHEEPAAQTNHQYKPLKSAMKSGCANTPKKFRFASSVAQSKNRKGASVKAPFGGLPNPAGTKLCFANCTVQCLKTTDINKILSHHKLCEVPCFICQLRIFYDGYPSLSCLGICQKMQDVWPQYHVGSEQDVHEMFQLIMDKLQGVTGGRDLYSDTFEGQIESSVCCGHCGAMSVNNEIYNNLSLSIKNNISVRQSVSDFFAEEQIKEYFCRSCHKSGTSKKLNWLTKIPTNLIVHLKRFDVQNLRRRKDSRQLDIDEEIGLRLYVKPELKNVLNDKGTLTAAVLHYGSLSNGHYYCFARAGMQWYKIDDTKVTKVKMTNDILREAYMLFYKMLPRPYIN